MQNSIFYDKKETNLSDYANNDKNAMLKGCQQFKYTCTKWNARTVWLVSHSSSDPTTIIALAQKQRITAVM